MIRFLATNAPILTLVFATIVAGALLNGFVNPSADECGVQLTDCQPHQAHIEYLKLDDSYWTPFQELESRTTWGLSVLLFSISLLFLVVLSLGAWRSTRLGVLETAAPLAVAVIGGAAMWVFDLVPAAQDFTFNRIILKPVDDIAPANNGFVSLVESGGVIALVLLAVAASLLLRASMSAVENSEDDVSAASAVSSNINGLRALLYVGGITLVAGTMHSAALYSWAETMIAPASQLVDRLPAGIELKNDNTASDTLIYSAGGSEISRAMGALNGMFYSILLGSIFAPAFLYMRHQTWILATRASGNGGHADAQKWLDEHGLSTGIPQGILSAVTVFAPAIMGGPIVQLVERLF